MASFECVLQNQYKYKYNFHKRQKNYQKCQFYLRFNLYLCQYYYIAMNNTDRNPLNVIFGAYLKRERNNLGETSVRMAKKLNLGESIYRMIEAGAVNLNINRAMLVVRNFKNSYIKFEQLSKYLVAAQVLEYELEKEKAKLNVALMAVSELDEDLMYFINKTADLYKIDYGTDDYKKNLEEVAVKEMGAFLGNEIYVPKTTIQFKETLLQEFLDIPSLQMPPIYYYLKSMMAHPLLHIGPVAKEWEEKTEGFTKLRGLYTDIELIISDVNLKLFRYPYLSEPKFTEFKLIFLTSENEIELKNRFIKKLNVVRDKVKLPRLSDIEIKKISFKTIPIHRTVFANEIEKLLMGRQDIFPKLKAYWSFSHDSGAEIGFVGGAEEPAQNYAINLTFGDSLERRQVFDIIWTAIN